MITSVTDLVVLRSAALFHLGHYQAASEDIKLALVHKYPKNIGRPE